MLHAKLLMQRLVCVPWLLVASLALWSGEALAQTLTARFGSMPESHDGSEFTFEIHFSEEIEMSYVNMRDDVLDVTGGAVTGARRLQQGSNIGWQITIVPEPNVDVSISLPPTVDCEAASAVCTADDRVLSSGLTALVPGLPVAPTNVVATLVNGVLSVTWEQTGTSQDQNTYRVKYREQGTTDWQPVVEERRLIDKNNNEVTYADGAGTTVPYVVAGLNSNATYEVQVRSVRLGLLSEWAPEPPILTVTEDSSDEVTEGSDQQTDDDRDSKNINLSVDIAELTRFDDETDITVTATLDGKVLNEDTSFPLIIGDHPDLTQDPNTDTNGDGDIDQTDATKDNREAQRDMDYMVTLATARFCRLAIL